MILHSIAIFKAFIPSFAKHKSYKYIYLLQCNSSTEYLEKSISYNYPSYLMLGIIDFVIESRPIMTDNVIVTLTVHLKALMDYLKKMFQSKRTTQSGVLFIYND